MSENKVIDDTVQEKPDDQIFKVITDKEFVAGYEDGKADRPRTMWTESYLHGYREGEFTRRLLNSDNYPLLDKGDCLDGFDWGK